MKVKYLFGFLLAILALLAVSSPARAESSDVYLPFHVELTNAPANIHFFVDTAGAMNQSVSGDDRKRYVIAVDVIAGYKQPLYYGKDNDLLYMPFLPDCETDKPATEDGATLLAEWREWREWCEPNMKTWLGDKVDEFTTGADGKPTSVMVEVIRLRKDALGYTPDPLGTYFMFIYKNDAIFDDTGVQSALTTLDMYMRDMCNYASLPPGGVCTYNDTTYYLKIENAAGTILLSDGTNASPYEVYTASDITFSDSTYEEALLKYYEYYDNGTTAGSALPTWLVIPVFHQAADATATYTDPFGNPRTAKCYYIKNKLQDCYWPTSVASSNYFVKRSDYSEVLSTWMTSNQITFETWYNSQSPKPTAYCQSFDYQVWGDGGIESLWFEDKFGKLMLDGIGAKPIYYGCDSTNPDKIADVGISVDADAIKTAMVDTLPYALSVEINEPNTVSDLKEFITTGGGERMDVYLRTALGLPNKSDISYIDLGDPWFGEFFEGLYYSQLFKMYPGIMDRYPDKNYGFGIYDQDNKCYDDSTGDPDDFPADDEGFCVGYDLLWNPPSYCEYSTQSCTAEGKNTELQDFLRERTLTQGANSPVSSFLHGFFRYFYNLNMVGFNNYDEYPHDTSTTDPVDFYTLPPADDITDTANAAMRHVIQGDPNYINKCRDNFLIMVLGNDQGGQGEKIHGPSNDDQQTVSFWAKRVAFGPPSEYFASGSQPTDTAWITNAPDPYGVADAASDLQDQQYTCKTSAPDCAGENIDDYSTSLDDYRFCSSDNEFGTRLCTTSPWGVRMFWIFFGDDSNKGALENAFYSSLSTFDELAAMRDLGELNIDYENYTEVPRSLDDFPKNVTFSEFIGESEARTAFQGYGYPFAVNNEAELDAAFEKIMKIINKGSYARTAPDVSTSEQAITAHYFDVDPKYPLYKGHVMAYDLKVALVDGTTNEYYYPALWSPADAGYILSETAMGDREIRVSRYVSGNVTDGVIGDITCSDMEPYISCSADGGTTTFKNTIGIIKNDPNTSFFNGTPPSWPLGGVFHSRPRIVEGTPDNFVSRGLSGYSDFSAEKAAAKRPAIVYVGTMNGQLHGFALDGSTSTGFEAGAEAFAYVPAAMWNEVPKLYNAHIMYGVDGLPTYADLYFPSDGASDPKDGYHTVLAFGLGGGGQAYYGLDVTNVNLGSTGSRAASVSTLWEYKDANLAYTWSTPLLHYANSDLTTWLGQPAMFFGGGLQNATDVNEELTPAYGPNNREGGFFYVINAEDGTLLRKFELFDKAEVGTHPDNIISLSESANYDNHNMVPGTPVFLDLDKNYTIDWGYVGDYQGRVWKFNMTDPDPSNWTHCIFYDTADLDGDGSLNGTNDLSDAERQPVWYRPEVALGPNGEHIVYFGTGDIELDKDGQDETRPNYYFAVVDQDATDSKTDCTYGQLVPQTLAGGTPLWPIQLEAGEKVVTAPIIAQQTLYFKTWLPATKKACSVGETRLYYLDYLTGEGVLNTPEGTKSYETVDSMSEMRMVGGKIIMLNPDPDKPIEDFKFDSKDKNILSWGEGIQY